MRVNITAPEMVKNIIRYQGSECEKYSAFFSAVQSRDFGGYKVKFFNHGSSAAKNAGHNANTGAMRNGTNHSISRRKLQLKNAQPIPHSQPQNAENFHLKQHPQYKTGNREIKTAKFQFNGGSAEA